MSEHSACDKVFNTYELLEQILGALPVRYLLLAQRLNSHVKALIERSVPLQQKLFRLPIQQAGAEITDHPLKDAVFGVINDDPDIQDTYDYTLQARMRYFSENHKDATERFFCPLNFVKHFDKHRKKSWWSMFATQPPVKEMRMKPVMIWPADWLVELVRKDKGITFGDMLVAAEDFWQYEYNHEDDELKSDWDGAVFFIVCEKGAENGASYV